PAAPGAALPARGDNPRNRSRISALTRRAYSPHPSFSACPSRSPPPMDVYNDGKRIVGPDRGISQNPDRFRAKRTLDVDLARRDVGQVRFWNGAQQRERIGATPRQGFGGQRYLWPQRERVAQFGVDKFDCAQAWQPGPFGVGQN